MVGIVYVLQARAGFITLLIACDIM